MRPVHAKRPPRPGPVRHDGAWDGLRRLGLARLGLARLGRKRLGPARFGRKRLGPARRVGVMFVASLAVVGLSGCGAMERISEGAYRNAVADGATADLHAKGVRLHGRPVCRTPQTGVFAEVRVTCTARTIAGEPVAISGTVTSADTSAPRERYQVTVGGRLLIDRECLGTGCQRPV